MRRRNLVSLIAEDRRPFSEHTGYREVPIDQISPNPEQPREVFRSQELKGLAKSIEEHGVLTPLLVRREGGKYILIAGERRLRGAALAGLSSVPVVIRDLGRSNESLELALVENLQREDLDPVEEARGFAKLIEDYSYTQEEVARRVGRERSTITNQLRLLRLPGFVLESLRRGEISAGHARALLRLACADDMSEALAKVINEGLSVRATERLAARLAERSPIPAKPRRRPLEFATRLLGRLLKTRVDIKPRKKGGGRIVIDYSDDEELERLIGELRDGRR
ncbi:MAG: ParB/RepB/Spo0J family partition protein [Proteobacteria bacterium]|jgi:ParB family transcriptional regulator, chromosome partitioning protein|nr:ParB/RepB/Spo0J family partition protein [Pseudomonadota bacterium]